MFAVGVCEDGPALGVDVGGLELGEVEVHAAVVLDLWVQRLGRVASGAGDYCVGSLPVVTAPTLEVDPLSHDDDGRRPCGGGPAAVATGDHLPDGEVSDLGEGVGVAAHGPLAQLGHLLLGQARVDAGVLKGPIQAVDMLL